MTGRALAALLAAAALGGCLSAKVSIKRGSDFSVIRRVAVVPFADDPRLPGSGDVVTAAFEESLRKAGYDVAEPDQIVTALRAQNLPGSGELDAKAEAAVGRLLGVDALVQGRITDLVSQKEIVALPTVQIDENAPILDHYKRVQRDDGTWEESEDPDFETKRTYLRKAQFRDVGGQLGVTARMVRASTGDVLWTGSETADADSIDDAANSIAADVLQAVKRTWPPRKKK